LACSASRTHSRTSFEFQLPKQFGELRLQRFLAHIFAAAGGWVALAFIGIAGAMIINVTLVSEFVAANVGAAKLVNISW
jgi:hypothetical protein